MKKVLILLLTGLMLFGVTATTLAAADSGAGTQTQPNNSESRIKVKDLQGYDQLLQMREDAKTTKDQIKADRQNLKDLIKAARDAKNTAALPVIKQYRTELQGLRTDLQSLRTEQKTNWADMKDARQAQDQAQMQTIMDRILSTRQALNDQLLKIKNTADEFIQALQAI
jgi:hypothetical protein